ncbi:MAG: F0F1 ATP synthase subunit alpha [Candidatus Omnitrophota bacterium]|nr:MAG: F0F1 ATP synthase subunit alpha [Candidatus Omnitrophota bacterium]
MGISPEEITQIIKARIEHFEDKVDLQKKGVVVEVGDGVAQVYGLNEVMANELLLFSSSSGEKVQGMALNLQEESIGAVLFGSDRLIKEGAEVFSTGEVVRFPVGEGLLGRVVNALGEPLDDGPPIKPDGYRPIEGRALGVIEREPVNQPLQTGIKSIDSMIPIGRGQRELIIGDRQTGKTALAIDTIINQKNEGVVCIYVAIGQKEINVARVFHRLKKEGAMAYTAIISASAHQPAPLQYIAPYSGCALGEYFRDQGRDALIIYDDLSKHAQSYRQISLLLRRPAGREAYPGDIFYTHSRLLERAAKANKEAGGGSLTALPIVETQAGDISTYIPTNLISITDGQIYLESSLFYQGIRPAINVGLSVSRVGGSAQIKAMKEVSGKLRLELAQYREMESFTKLGGELNKSTEAQLRRGARLVEILKQKQYSPMDVAEQIVVIFSGVYGFLDEIALKDVQRFEKELIIFFRSQYPHILKEIKEKKELNEQIKIEMRKAIKEFKERFVRSL